MKDLNRRAALLGAGSLAATSLTSVNVFAQGARDQDAVLQFVAPELRATASQALAMTAQMPPMSREALPALRASAKQWSQPPLASIPWQKRVISGSPGNPDVTVFVINAKPDSKRGGIVYMHGGGYVSGAAELGIRSSQELAAAVDCTIVSVEYRLAPETGYAGSLEDNYAALRWLHLHAPEFGVDPGRIALLGESAGGGHAALLAITARDRGEVPVVFQCLVYPMLDDRTGTARKTPPHIGEIIWTAKDNAFGWRSFLGREPGLSGNRAGVPGREPDLSKLPPAWIGVGGIDLFMPEDVGYAERLLEAGVPTELLVLPGAFHVFDVLGADTSLAKRFTAAKINALQRAFSS